MKVFVQMYFLRVIIILSLFVFTNCTVQKRIHRRGFHIEWHNNYAKKSVVDQNDDENNLSIELDEVVEEDLINDTQNATITEVEVIDTSTSIEKDEMSEKIVDNIGLKLGWEKVCQIWPVSTYFFKEINTKSAENDGNHSNAKPTTLELIAMFFAVMAVITLVGSLFLYFGFHGFGKLFNALVFSGNGFFVSVLGFILFLIILVLVFICVALVEFVFGGYFNGFIIGSCCALIVIVLGLISHYRSK